MLFWSEFAARSSWVRRELDLAFETPTRTLVVVRLDHKAVPDRLSDVVRIVAFHPGRPGVLVTAAEDWLSFWQLPATPGDTVGLTFAAS
ncbi:hypothetical protein ABT121_32240 [Streptomyces sp. NPDC001928]|uniref:hypothetical protein n=1 Tax=Streptomyces sp. NPDC001928 TaxID=3154404 RepID=UPI00331CFBBD